MSLNLTTIINLKRIINQGQRYENNLILYKNTASEGSQ